MFRLMVFEYSRRNAELVPSLDTPASDAQPGRYVHFRDGSESEWHRRHPMLLVELDCGLRAVDVIMKEADSPAGLTVRITIDSNEWIGTFAAWPYQVFVRWVPSIIFGIAGVAGAYFLAVHFLLINDRFVASTVEKRRTWRRRIASVVNGFVSGHLIALAFDTVASATMSVVIGVTGFYSTSNAPAWVTLFFTMQMSGWAFVATFVSSIVWVQRLERIIPRSRRRYCWRLISLLHGDHPRVTIVACLVFFLLEVAIDIWYATWQNWRSRWFPFAPLVAGIFALLELILGANFLVGTGRYLYEVSKTTIDQRDTAVHRVLRRIWWCALLIGLSMMLYVVCGVAMIAFYKWAFRPTGWTVVWGTGSIARATGCLARVFVFQPRPRRRARQQHLTIQGKSDSLRMRSTSEA